MLIFGYLFIIFNILLFVSDKFRLSDYVEKFLAKLLFLQNIFLGISYFVLAKNNNIFIYFNKLEIGFSFDNINILYLIMVNIVGLVIYNYSETYLHGDNNQNLFLRNLVNTIISVNIVITFGSLINLMIGWKLVNIYMNKLLRYFDTRPESIEVSKKRKLYSNISDVILLLSIVMLYIKFKSFNISDILIQIQNSKHLDVINYLIGLGLMIAAFIQAAQFPFNTWILEVMEAPTPVSAILHAGVINAGPYLILRFSYFFEKMPILIVVLIILSSLFASLAAISSTAQSEIKTALTYSSIAHMGFSFMLCGMGLYSAALLHSIAHSFYKAHAFLTSGSAVDSFRLAQFGFIPRPRASYLRTILGGIMSLTVLWILFFYILRGIDLFQFLILSGIVFFGVSALIIRTLNIKLDYVLLYQKLILYVIVLVFSFYAFEIVFHSLIHNYVPNFVSTKFIKLSTLIAFSIFLITFIFSMSTLHTTKDVNRKWIIWARNGFYIHLIFDNFLQKILNFKANGIDRQ